MKTKNLAIIVQARTGSSRMPNKVLQEFHDRKTLLEVLVDQLRLNTHRLEVIIATTNSKNDAPIVNLAERLGVKCFRGDENNVLKRFIDCCEHFNLAKCIRVCSDNPFMSVQLIDELVNFDDSSSGYDYLSFAIDGKPGIKTHLGIFPELVSVKGLALISENTNERYYQEHVTNYLYENSPVGLELELIPKDQLREYETLRLTVDTLQDFENCKTIFSGINQNERSSLKEINQFVERHPEISESMLSQITQNEK